MEKLTDDWAVKVTVFELTAPGFTTLTGTLPAVAGAVTGAVRVPAFTNVVVTALPLNIMVAPLWKFEPLTVNVNEVLTVADAGERPDMTGAATAVAVKV